MMAHQANGISSKRFQGLPGEEDFAGRAYDNHFEELYGKDVNAEKLYLAQVSTWARFAKVHHRIAFLLEQLHLIYENIDTSLDLFKLNYSHASPESTLSQQSVRFRGLDPFSYFSSEGVEYEHRSCLLHLRAALDKWDESTHGPIFREAARDVVHNACATRRTAIVEEILSHETAVELNRIPVSRDACIWIVRRDLARQEEMLTHSLQRIKQALDRHEKSNEELVSYGDEPVAPIQRFPPSPVRESHRHSPERRHVKARFSNRSRSVSRDSIVSSRAAPSSVTTWAPVEPDHFTLSIKVWSATKAEYVESLAVMDTGCEGGNFVSSVFLSEHLDMFGHIVDDADAHRVQWVDIGGSTDFKPSGRVQLKWIGRDIENGGRKGKRTVESTSWFHVAPHLDSESGEQPFQILLGKEFLHENEIIQYRGLRLYKSKTKKSSLQLQEEQAETLRRQQQRRELEIRRSARRVSIDEVPSTMPTLSTRTSDDLSLRSRATSGTGDSPRPDSVVGD